MMLTEKQYNRIRAYNKIVNKFVPQLRNKSLKPLAEKLAKILPDYCVFHREHYIKNVLIVYIPSLCNLNPLFDYIMEIKSNVDK